MKKKTVLIADDHDLIRDGIKSILIKFKDIQIVGEAKNGNEAINLFDEFNPDLLILDISMPLKNGVEVAKEIFQDHENASIIMLSMYDDLNYVSTCLEMGVKGYVIKSESATELGAAIETVLSGKQYFSRLAQNVIINKYKHEIARSKSASSEFVLTPREIEIVRLIAKGMTSLEISEKLFISQRTVETHRGNLLKKLGVKNAIEMVKKAEQMDLLS